MKALVTGGAGFIGSHIVDMLLERGCDVAIIDDLSSGKIENVNPRATLHKISICEEGIDDIICSEKPQAVFHTAAQVSVAFSVREPIADANVNIMGAIRLLQSCVKAKVGRVVFSSSGGTVYGEVPGDPAKESDPFAPMAPYGISKMCFEYYLDFFRHEHGLEFTTLRYGNVYGPRQDPHGEAGVVAIFSMAALKGETLRINGDGMFYRDYVHVNDVARANIACIDRGECGAFNIGTGVPRSVVDIFNAVVKAAGVDINPVFGPARPGDLRRSVLDTGKADRVLGWSAKTDFEDGIAETVDFFRKRIS